MTDAPLPTPAFDPRWLFSAKYGHAGALGIQHRAHGTDWTELALPYDPKLIGDPDTGVLASGRFSR